jgi:hypothetical protein
MMKRAGSVATCSSDDERELQFDVRRLDSGDAVDVFIEGERQWLRGTFQISTAGEAWIDIPRRGALAFESALAMGLKRVLH